MDLFFTVLLAAAAPASLLGGGTRVLLCKDAVLSLVVGSWVLSTGFTRIPLAFQLGRRLHRGPAARARSKAWQDSAEFRQGLRALTLLWGSEQILDGGFGTLAALTLPTDTVPLLARVQSLVLLALAATATAVHTRRFRARHGLPLFGVSAAAGMSALRPPLRRPPPGTRRPPSRKTARAAAPENGTGHALGHLASLFQAPTGQPVGPSPLRTSRQASVNSSGSVPGSSSKALTSLPSALSCAPIRGAFQDSIGGSGFLA